MSQSDAQQTEACAEWQSSLASVGATPETRIDAPHMMAGQEASTLPAAVSDLSPAVAPALPTSENAASLVDRSHPEECISRQAEQLASHLRARQQEIDHREAELNARLAQLDRDMRTARLWLTERQAELQQREEDLDRQQQEVLRRLERLAAAEAALSNRGAPGKQAAEQVGEDRQRQSLEARVRELDGRQAQIAPELVAREEVLRHATENLQTRQRKLEEAEARLAAADAETKSLRAQLLEDRRIAEEEARTQRQRLVAEQRLAREELEKRREAVQRRSAHLDQCESALKQLRGELGRMHRETLEIRLATEELWVQLSDAAPPAAISRSLGRIRSKLADHYRMANGELQQQKIELETIRKQLSRQYEKLVQQKEQFEHWVVARREEADQHAARLIAREEQLQQRHAELNDGMYRWQAERLEYQHQIRRLRARCSEPCETAVVV